MKYINWILHAISLIAILFLFIQNGKLKNKSSQITPVIENSDLGSNSGKIAYFLSDTLLGQLGFFKDSEKEFKAKQERLAGELRSRENTLKKEFEKLQASAQNLTRKELEAGQEKLAGMERDLMQRKEKMEMEFADETAEFNEKLHQKIISYLQEINADKKYSFVFSVQRGGNIFYSDPAMDITAMMVKDLNEKYSK
ncbi:MAG: OmpH family outer membrane protein [Saprospiraceae bacterium]|nr:OmpH family outer membrane protein [Saprospiraceae bacterium]